MGLAASTIPCSADTRRLPCCWQDEPTRHLEAVTHALHGQLLNSDLTITVEP